MPGLHVYPGPELLEAERRQGPVHAPLTSGAGLPYVRRDREVMALILKVPTAAHPAALAGQAGGVAGYAGLTNRVESARALAFDQACGCYAASRKNAGPADSPATLAAERAGQAAGVSAARKCLMAAMTSAVCSECGLWPARSMS